MVQQVSELDQPSPTLDEIAALLAYGSTRDSLLEFADTVPGRILSSEATQAIFRQLDEYDGRRS